MKKKLLFFTPLMALLLAGCYARIPLPGGGGGGGSTSGTTTTDPETDIAVTSVTISPKSLALDTASLDQQLSVEVLPENATDKSVTWSVNEEGKDVVSVNDSGLVHVLGVGSAKVTATSVSDTSKSDTCEVTVSASTKSALEIAILKYKAGETDALYKFSGVITGITGSYFYIQEGSVGMYVFKCNKTDGSADPALGKTVEIEAKLTEYNGYLETAEGGTYTVGDDGTLPTPASATTKEIFDGLEQNVLVSFPKLKLVNKPGTWTSTMSKAVRPTFYIGDDTSTQYQISLDKHNYVEANANEYNNASVGGEFVLSNAITSYFSNAESPMSKHTISLSKNSTLTRVQEHATAISFKETSYDVDQGTVSKNMKNELDITPSTATDPITFAVSGNNKVSIDSSTGVLSVAADAVAETTATVTATIEGLTPATCTIVVKAASTSKTFTRINSTTDLTSGKYLIVSEEVNFAFDGSLTDMDATPNTVSISHSGGTIVYTSALESCTFTYNPTDESLKSESGYYIGRNTDKNGIESSETTVYKNTITFDGNNAVVTSKSGRKLQYNNSDGQKKFRYFGGTMVAIQFYKLVS